MARRKDGEGKSRVLIADDDPVTLRMLDHFLKEAEFQTASARDGREAMRKMSADFDVAVFDLEMPRATGLECLKYVREQYPDTVVIVISGKGGIEDAVEAIKLGATDYITKPIDRDELMTRVNKASWAAKLSRDNKGLREAVSSAGPSSDFVANSPGGKEVVRQVSKVAKLDTTVLMTGESGTGKTTVARMIHQLGSRADGPFVTVNCASLPRDLVEAELFGHAKGAFTGALNDRPGRVEIADGGTLFLDEIGDLPLELQPKLLTFLQDRTFQRIGSNKVYTVDVRLITATHQDLKAMCASKRFREDLYFRLNVISIRIPPLRERREDIPQLVERVLARIGRQRGETALSCAPDAINALQQHDWRGNIRELENVLERASAFCEESQIQLTDITFEDGTPLAAPKAAAVAAEPAYAGKTLAEIERLAILETLDSTNGNKAEAARRLGISEKSIYNKMKRFEA